MGYEVTEETHLDHGVSRKVQEWVLDQIKDNEGFCIGTFDLPMHLSSLQSGLYGPLMGDPPVQPEDVYHKQRGDRPGESRMVSLPLRPTRKVTVVAGPHEGRDIVYTIYGGPCAPREPFDSSLNESDRREAETFWSQHALSDQGEEP